MRERRSQKILDFAISTLKQRDTKHQSRQKDALILGRHACNHQINATEAGDVALYAPQSELDRCLLLLAADCSKAACTHYPAAGTEFRARDDTVPHLDGMSGQTDLQHFIFVQSGVWRQIQYRPDDPQAVESQHRIVRLFIAQQTHEVSKHLELRVPIGLSGTKHDRHIGNSSCHTPALRHIDTKLTSQIKFEVLPALLETTLMGVRRERSWIVVEFVCKQRRGCP